MLRYCKGDAMIGTTVQVDMGNGVMWVGVVVGVGNGCYYVACRNGKTVIAPVASLRGV